MVDRAGRRVRVYRRKTSGPSKAVRRHMVALGFSWCRGCRTWLSTSLVRKGACPACRNAEYRARYRRDGEAIRRRVRVRARGVDVVPDVGREALLDRFDGRCAYCPAPATTWDHVEPVSRGGQTEPGNVVPACISCNSSKRDGDVAEWLVRTGRTAHPALIDTIALSEAA